MCIYNANKNPRKVAEESLQMVVVEKPKTESEIKDTSPPKDSPTTRIGADLHAALLVAQLESRAIIGVPAAVEHLSIAPENSLFCVLAPPKIGDSATHMQEVLLQAFCFENDIYIIQVDSAEKLGRLLKVDSIAPCVLIQKTLRKERTKQKQLNSPTEDALVDFCEAYWDAPKQPIVQLPDT